MNINGNRVRGILVVNLCPEDIGSWRPEDIGIWCPEDIGIWCPEDIGIWCPQDIDSPPKYHVWRHIWWVSRFPMSSGCPEDIDVVFWWWIYVLRTSDSDVLRTSDSDLLRTSGIDVQVVNQCPQEVLRTGKSYQIPWASDVLRTSWGHWNVCC